MFSPVIRALITSLPCCTQPSLIIPNCSTTVVQHLVKILECGYTTGVPSDSFKQVYEIIELAKILDIDVSDLRRDVKASVSKEDVVKSETKRKDKNLKTEIVDKKNAVDEYSRG